MTQTANAPDALKPCPHCGMIHATTCPRIKSIDYHENGTIKRIEFVEPAVAQSALWTGQYRVPNIISASQFIWAEPPVLAGDEPNGHAGG